MVYHLNETELNQLNTWSAQLPRYYSESDALRLNGIVIKALGNGYLDEDDIYELLDLLPRIIPETEEKLVEALEDNNTDWCGHMDEQRARYSRDMDKLHQTLSSWIFLQSAVYRKNMKRVGSPLDKAPAKGKEHGIKKLR